MSRRPTVTDSDVADAIYVALEHPERANHFAVHSRGKTHYVHPVRFQSHWSEYSSLPKPSVARITNTIRFIWPVPVAPLGDVTSLRNSGWRRIDWGAMFRATTQSNETSGVPR